MIKRIHKRRGSPRFIQKAVRHPGRVRKYIARSYGSEAFNTDGTIKAGYLEKAKHRAMEHHNKSLVDAIDLAITLKKK